MTRKEIKPLTSIRMIAALLVFLYHFAKPAETFLGNIILEGHIGVTIFFVLSGFLLSLRYYDDFARDGLSWTSFVDYYRRRFARIYPLYAVLLITVASLPVNTLGVIHWTLTQAFFDGARQTGIYPAWSLTVEESFYLLLPIVIVLPIFNGRSVGNLIAKLITVQVVLLVVGIAIVGLSNATGAINTYGFMQTTEHAILWTIFGRFWDFGVGMVAAAIYKRGAAKRRITAEIATFGGIILIALAANAMHIQGGVYGGWHWNYVVAIGTGLLLWGLAQPSTMLSRPLNWSPLVYLGRVSYALYLVQGTILFSGEKQTTLNSIYIADPTLFVIMHYIAATVISIALYEVVEKPMQRRVLRWTDCRQKPAQDPL